MQIRVHPLGTGLYCCHKGWHTHIVTFSSAQANPIDASARARGEGISGRGPLTQNAAASPDTQRPKGKDEPFPDAGARSPLYQRFTTVAFTLKVLRKRSNSPSCVCVRDVQDLSG